jgi:hypothetical protein
MFMGTNWDTTKYLQNQQQISDHDMGQFLHSINLRREKITSYLYIYEKLCTKMLSYRINLPLPTKGQFR